MRRFYPIEWNITFSAELIRKAKLLAQADERTMVKPINVEGIGDTYVMVVDQWQTHALKKDPGRIEAQKFANVRGDKNPIFTAKTFRPTISPTLTKKKSITQ